MSKKILVIAGEHSGDMRAAEVIAAVNQREPNTQWFGIGGPRMRQQGAETRHDVDEMAVMGIGEVLRRYGFFRQTLEEMVAWAEENKPDLALFIDYPGFNLRLAKRIHALGIKTVYYICPQVWAWHRGRIPKMAQYLDHMLSIFPFEAEHFKNTALPVTYVGHPLLESIEASSGLPEYRLPWNAIHRVAILPGSRKQEIARLLPVMLEAGHKLQDQVQDCGFLVAAAGQQQVEQIQSVIQKIPHSPKKLTIIEGHTRDIVAQADAAMVCSGTATVETALLKCPMAVCYRAHPITYFLIRPFIRVPNIGMVNIIAEKEICPELIQGKCTPRKLAETMEKLIHPSTDRLDMLNDLQQVRARMGNGGAAKNAADVIVDMLGIQQTQQLDYDWS